MTVDKLYCECLFILFVSINLNREELGSSGSGNKETLAYRSSKSRLNLGGFFVLFDDQFEHIKNYFLASIFQWEVNKALDKDLYVIQIDSIKT